MVYDRNTMWNTVSRKKNKIRAAKMMVTEMARKEREEPNQSVTTLSTCTCKMYQVIGKVLICYQFGHKTRAMQ